MLSYSPGYFSVDLHPWTPVSDGNGAAVASVTREKHSITSTPNSICSIAVLILWPLRLDCLAWYVHSLTMALQSTVVINEVSKRASKEDSI